MKKKSRLPPSTSMWAMLLLTASDSNASASIPSTVMHVGLFSSFFLPGNKTFSFLLVLPQGVAAKNPQTKSTEFHQKESPFS